MWLWILNQIYNDTLNRRTWMVSSAKDFRLLWSPRIAFVISSQGVRILTNSNVVVLPWKASSPDNIMASLDRSQSDFYFVPQEIQTDTATPLSMEIFGRIDFSLGRLITRVTKTPKPTKQHVTWAVELVRIFFHSLLWPWEPLSWRSLWNCSVGWHDFPPIWVHDFSLPIASSTQPEGYTMPIYYYAYKNTESRLNWNSFNPWRCFYMDVVYTKTNVKTETEAKTKSAI